jgi:hypothetical protein
VSARSIRVDPYPVLPSASLRERALFRSELMQQKEAVAAYFAKFSADLCKWVVVCRAYGLVRAEFDSRAEAEEYAELHIQYEFARRRESRVKTLPPPAMTTGAAQ